MTFREIIERTRLHAGEIAVNDLVMLFNDYAVDFVMRTGYGIHKFVYDENNDTIDEDDLTVVKIESAWVNEKRAAVLPRISANLTGMISTTGNIHALSIERNKAQLYWIGADKIVTAKDFSDVDSVTLYGCFWYDIDESSGLESDIDTVIARSVLYKVWSELFLRNPETIEMAKIYDDKYERDIYSTRRKYNKQPTHAQFKHYEM